MQINMYSGWISDRTTIEDNCGTSSVLNNYPDSVGKDVTSSIIRSLNFVKDKKSFFKTEKDIEWTMDVICYGLTMPLTEVEMIKNCMFIYRDWTTVMSTKPNAGIPQQIVDSPIFYFNKMLKHLTNLFIPRESNATVLQATLCGQILSHIRSIVQEGQLGKSTHEAIIRFYLGISGHLLSPPPPPLPGSLAEQLVERIINSLINVWLHICCYHFPTPTIWATLTEMMLSWRHYESLIEQWNMLMYALTPKVLSILFGPDYPLPLLFTDQQVFDLPKNLSDELIVQCWFRFLHIIGKPVSLSKISEISGTDYFKIYGITHERTPESHSSLKSLPSSFYKAMDGVSNLVQMFLGESLKTDPARFSLSTFSRGEWKYASASVVENIQKTSLNVVDKCATVPGVRRLSDQPRSSKTVQDDSNLKSNKTVLNFSTDTNCILHLFGSWLFDVTLSGVNIEQVLQSVGMISCGLRPKSLQLTKEEKEQSGRSLIMFFSNTQCNGCNSNKVKSCSTFQGLCGPPFYVTFFIPSNKLGFPPIRKNEFEPGRAKAFSTLCQIFCHHLTTGQAILPVYLSRFYLSIAVGLCYSETRAAQVLCSILFSATDLLRLDLQGCQVLVPHILQAIELILPTAETELILGYNVNILKLRRSCIEFLLSMICLPLHFLQLNIQGLCREKVPHSSEANFPHQITFLSLKERLTKLLFQALEVEMDPVNTQMLLGGAMVLMEDTMHVEFKRHEFSKLPPGSVPCIMLDDSDTSAKSSPKLIHLAKTPVCKPGAHTDLNKPRSKSTVSKNLIGLLGKRSDLLSTKGQFVYMTKILCQKLVFTTKWRGDLHVTLSALECLAEMAQLDAMFIDHATACKTLTWACDYIEFQAKQPPPSHSKDLHSIIIAAFSCISCWLINHPWLLDDQQCLNAVLEVIELGISGFKSKSQSHGGSIAYKGEKELKPVSFRVRESAEALLALIMEHLGFFPTPCGPAAFSTLLDEEKILETSTNSDKKFHYYALDGSIIIGIHDESVQGLTENLPSVTVIIRGPTGKRVCLMQLRHFSRENQHFSELYKLQPERPLGMQYTSPPPPVSQQCFPPDVDDVLKINADFSIPDINSILNARQQQMQDDIKKTIKLQEEETNAAAMRRKANSFGLGGFIEDISQKQPKPVDDHKSTKLLLSHLGWLQLRNLMNSTAHVPSLESLKCEDTEFLKHLNNLDAVPSRTFDTLYVFYMKKGQSDATAIQNNKIPSLDHQFFMEFLHSLGWKVNLASHTGWNGDMSTSWRLKRDESNKIMFYYADLLTELAIHVPALNLNEPCRPESTFFDEVDRGLTEEIPIFEINEKQSASRKSSESEGVKAQRKHAQFEQTGTVEVKHRSHTSQSETRVLIVWLQDFNDYVNFPALELIELNEVQQYSYFSNTSPPTSRVPDKEVVIIYIHPLKTGLFRIKTETVFGSPLSGPIINGMVVSRRVLGTMVRNTAINICRRRRLDIDSYSAPHVCRKIKVQDIIRRYKQENNIPEFYASLFNS